MFTPFLFLDLALSIFFSIIVFCICIHYKAAKKNLNHNEEKSFWYDYEDDFYKFHHLEECQISTNLYGARINCEERKFLIDSIIDAHYALNLAPETLYLCVNIIDRFLSKLNPPSTPIEKIKFVPHISLLLASKYEERRKLHVRDLIHIPPEVVCETEKLILQKLDWNLTVTTPYVFLVRNIKDEDKMMENMVFFFSELSLTHYSIVCDYKPSMIAASAVYCARIVIGRYPLWNNDLKICTGTGYSEKELRSCAMVMIELCNEICRDGTMHVFRKFSSRDYCEVACVAKREISKKLFYHRICLNMGQYFSFQFIKRSLKALY